MRQLLLAATAVPVHGCASEPAVEPEVATTCVPTTQPEARSLEAARKLGYKVVNDAGEILYCRSQTRLASRIRKETICLTEEQLPFTSEARERNIENIGERCPDARDRR